MTQALQCKQCHGPITTNDYQCRYCGTLINDEFALQAKLPNNSDPAALLSQAPGLSSPTAAAASQHNFTARKPEPAPEQLNIIEAETPEQTGLTLQSNLSFELEANTPPVLQTLAESPGECTSELLSLPDSTPEQPMSTPELTTPVLNSSPAPDGVLLQGSFTLQASTSAENILPPQNSFAAPNDSAYLNAGSAKYDTFIANSTGVQNAEPPDLSLPESDVENPAATVTSSDMFELAEMEMNAEALNSMLLHTEVLDVESYLSDEELPPETVLMETPESAVSDAEPEKEYAPISYNSLIEKEKDNNETPPEEAPALALASAVSVEESLFTRDQAFNKKVQTKSVSSKKGGKHKLEPQNKLKTRKDKRPTAPKPPKATHKAPYFVMLPLLSIVFSVAMLLLTTISFYGYESHIGLLIIFPVWPLGLTFFAILTFLSPLREATGIRVINKLVALNAVFNIIMCLLTVIIIVLDLPVEIIFWSLGWFVFGFILPLIIFFMSRRAFR